MANPADLLDQAEHWIWDFGGTICFPALPWSSFFHQAPEPIKRLRQDHPQADLAQFHQLLAQQHPDQVELFMAYRRWFESQLLSFEINSLVLPYLDQADKRHYIWSNNMLSTIEWGLKQFHLTDKFNWISATDNMLELKPAPAGFYLIQKHFTQVRAENSLMIGDSETDRLAAARVNLPFVWVQQLS